MSVPSKMKCVNWRTLCELRSGLIEAGMKLQKPSSPPLSFAHVFSLQNPPGGEILKKSKISDFWVTGVLFLHTPGLLQ